LPSILRLAGLLVGIAFIVAALWFGRRRRGGVLLIVLGVTGVGLAIITITPDIVRPIQDFFGLGDAPVGRILTVLVLAVGVAYLLLFYGLAKGERNAQRLRRLIRALSAAELELEGFGIHPLGGVLVCIPAFNEEEALPGVLAEIPAKVCDRQTYILVVDDASTDGTRSVAQREGAHVVSQPVNSGQGAALQTGYLIAERLGVDIVVTLDADGQHDPAEMQRLVEPIVKDRADFVVGSRRHGEYEREAGGGGAARNVGISLFTALMNLLGGTTVSDVANGYRAIRASRLAAIVFTEDQFHNPELLLGASRAGLRILEVPVSIRRRAAGITKKGSTLRYGVGFLRVIVRSWLR
jgi:hypothetical protein